ncbi:MAG: hypothetical protein QTN59_09430 [Candidatus Electrothrix communis]|nr:hypothetical protein [Desulfobulbus sp. US4]WLE99044.1 MAG: hypothetical protein QTN59_09430 [Candidatus Electrothrix communis]
MFDRLKEKIGERLLDSSMEMLSKLNPEWITVDPARFHDPVALETIWLPVKSKGTTRKTHKLKKINSDRLEFRATVGEALRYLLLVAVGIALLFFLLGPDFATGQVSLNRDLLIPMLIYALPLYWGGRLLYHNTTPLVFDRQKRLFWKGRKTPESDLHGEFSKPCVRLNKIHALQLIRKYVTNWRFHSSFSYELNLVLQDGSRIHVVPGGKRSHLREDAIFLAHFLHIPLWDATDSSTLSLPDYALKQLDNVSQQQIKKFTLNMQSPQKTYKDYMKKSLH